MAESMQWYRLHWCKKGNKKKSGQYFEISFKRKNCITLNILSIILTLIYFTGRSTARYEKNKSMLSLGRHVIFEKEIYHIQLHILYFTCEDPVHLT